MSGTATTFDNMLNQYLPNELLKEEFKNRDWLLKNIESDDTWLGGTLIVPFQGGNASSYMLGGLTAQADINQVRTVRGQITSQPEAWGSMIFNEKDLVRHGKISEQNLLRILPDQIEDFVDYMRRMTSLMFTNGATIATATAVGSVSSGIITVDRPDRLVIGQPVLLSDANGTYAGAPSAFQYWISQINMETGAVTFTTDQALATIANLTGYTVTTIVQLMGANTAANQFTSLKASLLSSANGGSSTLYGVSKLTYPYLQAINVDGSGFTAASFLDDIFDAMTKVRVRGAAMADTVLMSYQNFGMVLKALQIEKGPYRKSSEESADQYSWTEVEIVGPKGRARIVAIQEIDNSYMPILDMRAMKLYSNGFFRKREAPDGKQFYEVRNTSGFQYIVDIAFYGDFVLQRPSRCGIVHDVPDLNPLR